MAHKVRAHVLVAGKVQGVYFRQNTMEQGKQHGVSGWVRNLPNGCVEAVFEGDEDDVNKVIEWCKSGPPRAQVQNVDVKYQSYTGEFSDFVISY